MLICLPWLVNEVSGLQFAEVWVILVLEANGTALIVAIPARKNWQLNFCGSINIGNCWRNSLSLFFTCLESSLKFNTSCIICILFNFTLSLKEIYCVSELLRVIRRLSMKEQWTDTPLQYLTLRTLYSALSENPRGQNHFRSIGGLEVLLDGLGLPPNNPLISKISCCSDEER